MIKNTNSSLNSPSETIVKISQLDKTRNDGSELECEDDETDTANGNTKYSKNGVNNNKDW